jgi:hypothetical protein
VPAPGSRRGNSSNDPTNQKVISKSRDSPSTSLDYSSCPFQPKDVVNSHWWGVAPFVHKDETWMGGTGAR